MTLKCDWYGAEREKMTIWEHPNHGVLCLCFRGCQHFKEPRTEKNGALLPSVYGRKEEEELQEKFVSFRENISPKNIRR